MKQIEWILAWKCRVEKIAKIKRQTVEGISQFFVPDYPRIALVRNQQRLKLKLHAKKNKKKIKNLRLNFTKLETAKKNSIWVLLFQLRSLITSLNKDSQQVRMSSNLQVNFFSPSCQSIWMWMWNLSKKINLS